MWTLAPLHVAALRLDPDTVRTLERLGLKTIGALIDMPRLALARRFRGAEDVVDALDRMLGRKAEPLTAAPSDPPPRATLRLEEPATHPEAAAQALERLIPEARAPAASSGISARGGCRSPAIGSTAASPWRRSRPRSPAASRSICSGCWRTRRRRSIPEFGFDAFALTADWTEELGAAQDSLVEEPSGERELARLVDRLTVKLGPRAVRRPQAAGKPFARAGERVGGGCRSSLPPSRGRGTAQRAAWWRGRRHAPPPLASPAPLPQRGEELSRPHRLLDRPEAIDVIYATPEGMPRRFMWRRAVHDIARVEGPERIAPEWWRQPSIGAAARLLSGRGRRAAAATGSTAKA